MTPKPAEDPGPARSHYSYSVYADPSIARTFDARRFGGPIGELVAGSQARVLLDMAGDVHHTTVLDVGTGTGRAAILLAAAGASVTGVDASTEMLAIARRRSADESLPIAFEIADAHALPFADCSIDLAVSLRVLMHTPEWRRCVNELCRVARHRVIVDYPAAASAAAIESAFRRVTHLAGARTEPYRVFRDGTMARAFEQNGFAIRSVHRQFALPIALHKRVGSSRFTSAAESFLARAGLLRAFGSPVTIVAERCAS